MSAPLKCPECNSPNATDPNRSGIEFECGSKWSNDDPPGLILGCPLTGTREAILTKCNTAFESCDTGEHTVIVQWCGNLFAADTAEDVADKVIEYLICEHACPACDGNGGDCSYCHGKGSIQ